MSEQRSTRAVLIRRRWQSILAITILTFTIEIVAARVESDKLESIYYLPPWSFLALGLAAVALLFHLPWRRVLAALGLRHAFGYPPYWFGIAFGTAAAFYAVANELMLDNTALSIEAKANFRIAAATLGSLPILALILSLFVFTSRKRTPENNRWDSRPQPLAQQNLSTWYLNDKPVSTPELDRFDHRHIARRMAMRLAKSDAPAQALVGRLGSGKTTVRELVQLYLSEHVTDPPVLITVELWPYETPRAAVEGILDAVSEAFSRDIRTSQLSGIPTEYAEVIAKLSGMSKWLPNAVERKAAPPSVLLQRFDDVATSIRKRYVLWIEDLERFAGGHGPADSAELERLAPIRALLFGLDRLQSITVVTATTDLFRRFDLEKIARYVEHIPELDSRTSRRLLSQVRQQWLSANDIIHVSSHSHSDRPGWYDLEELDNPEIGKMEAVFFDDRIYNLASAVAALANTPRILKQGLRRAHETWFALQGEIDIDDVLALSMLREAAPNAYALLERNIGSLRRGNRDRDVWKDRKEPVAQFSDDLSALTTPKLDAQTIKAITTIVKYIFAERRNRPQGIALNNHADYWSRFQTIPTLSEEERDQKLLRELRDNDDLSIVERLSDKDRATAVEDFSFLIDGKRLARLLGQIIARRTKENPNTWNDRHAPGLIPIWRIARKHRNGETLRSIAEEIERGIEASAPFNIALTYELVYWFATSSRDLDDLLNEETRNRIKNLALKVFLKHYIGHPDLLARNLKGSSPFTLLWLCYGLERAREDFKGIPFEAWNDFSPTLLDSLKIAPDVMAFQIAPFVLRSSRKLRGPDRWVFDDQNCHILFGEVAGFIRIFREKTNTLEADPLIEAVREQQRDISEDDDESVDSELADDAPARSEDPPADGAPSDDEADAYVPPDDDAPDDVGPDDENGAAGDYAPADDALADDDGPAGGSPADGGAPAGGTPTGDDAPAGNVPAGSPHDPSQLGKDEQASRARHTGALGVAPPTAATMPITDQLATIAQLTPGWLNGHGRAYDPRVLETVRTLLERWIESHELPWPFIYPTPESEVRVEWPSPAWDVVITFNGEGSAVWLFATATESDAEIDQRFSTAQTDDIKRLGLELERLIKGQAV